MKYVLFISVLIYEFIKSSDSACIESGVFENPNDDSCQSYTFCFRLPDGVFIEKLYNCPNGTLFDSITKICSKRYTCIPPRTTETTTSTESPKTIECTSQGRFPQEYDATCTQYFFCYYLPTGKYLKINYTCPMGTQFDPKLQTCSSKFRCNVDATTVPNTITSVIPATYNCTGQGRFPVEGDETCRSYHYCLYLPDGSYTQQTYLCPSELKFNPKTQACSSNFQCSTTTDSTTTQRNDFVCPTTGRFPDDADKLCKTYYYCIQLPSGQLGYQKYKCPENLNFDPIQQICSESYNCRTGTSGTTPNILTSTFSILTTPFRGETTQYNDTTTPYETIGVSTTTSSYSSDESDYYSSAISTSATYLAQDICESTGRSPDPSDLTCTSYFLCAKGTDDKFIGFKYKCASNELFDPNLEKCSSTYTCNEDSYIPSSDTLTGSTASPPPSNRRCVH